MDSTRAKPRLVFFQYKYDERLPAFLLTHKQEHVQCLSEFFEVTVINEDCDYREICDKYRPDLALFESGVNHATCRKLEIRNVRSNEHIPRIGMHHADAFCDARAGFLSDMDHWGIEAFFAISTTAAEHTPEIADKLFSWPVFIDPEIHHDYGAEKTVPVLFSGNTNQVYPWRRKILKRVSGRYSSLICPHPGYAPRSNKTRLIVGEDYARTLNSAWFVPACGTVAKEIVRKHFEIPACRSCLVTERSPALEAAGFVDMENCVFADEHDVVDKLDYLFAHPEELRAITDAGHRLVHSRHTLQHRDQIAQWFRLRKTLKANERIVQPGPFERLITVPASSAGHHSHLSADGLHLTLLRQGDEQLSQGNYKEAERLYQECRSYMRWMPEPKLRLAFCSLYQGNAPAALSWIEEPIHFILCVYKAVDPDPVEWACFIRTLLCLGKVAEAARRSRQFPWLRHPELDRIRWVADSLQNDRFAAPPVVDEISERRRSMHQLPAWSLQEWIEQLCLMLRACGQQTTAATVAAGAGSACKTHHDRQEEAHAGAATKNATLRPENQDRMRPSARTVFFFRRRALERELRLKTNRLASNVLHRIEARFAYFLPYHLSESRNDEFFKLVRNLGSEEEIETALLIGATPGSYSTEAFLAGLLENEKAPSVFCVSASRGRLPDGTHGLTGSTTVRWYGPAPSGAENLATGIEKTVEKISEQNGVGVFDAILIDGRACRQEFAAGGALSRQLRGAKCIILDDLSGHCNGSNRNLLLKDPNYFASAQNSGLRNGYAIFKKNPATVTVPNLRSVSGSVLS